MLSQALVLAISGVSAAIAVKELRSIAALIPSARTVLKIRFLFMLIAS
jgi:hypothetical protein